MGFRFSKSFKIGPARLNLSKSGVGASLGVKGFRVGSGPRGSYASVGIPGTGISHRSSLGGRNKSHASFEESVQALKITLGCFGIVLLAITELVLLVAMPWLGVLVAVVTVGSWVAVQHGKLRNPEWLYQRKAGEALAHMRRQNWEAALAALQECEAIVPAKPATLGAKGQVLFQLHRWEEAIQALRAGPVGDTERIMLAEALRHTKRFAESNEALTVAPVDEALALSAILVRAANHLELKEPEVAIEVLKTAPLRKRNLDGPLKQAHYLLARGYEEIGQEADAIRHLRRVYAADAKFLDVEAELRRLQTPRA